MANPLFNAMGGRGNSNVIQQFLRFREQMGNQDPQKILSDLVSSGKVNQQQLNMAQQQAQQMSGMFEQIKGMFR